MDFKNLFNKKKPKNMRVLNSKTIDHIFDFDDKEDCRFFLNNFYMEDKRITEIVLQNGQSVKMEDIPDDQIIQRAKELRSWFDGNKTKT